MWWGLPEKGVEIHELREAAGSKGFSGCLFYSEVFPLHEYWESLEMVVLSPGTTFPLGWTPGWLSSAYREMGNKVAQVWCLLLVLGCVRRFL